jgi:plastocyanin
MRFGVSLRILRTAMLLAGVLLIAGVAGACGDDGSSSDGSDAGATTPRVLKRGTAPAGAPAIDQAGLEFIPNKLSVKAGETVYFTNSETAVHTVTINRKNESGDMKRGDLLIWVAPAAGDYRITCEYHPQMKATITVQ